MPCGCSATRGVEYPPTIFRCPVCGTQGTPKFIEYMGVATMCTHKSSTHDTQPYTIDHTDEPLGRPAFGRQPPPVPQCDLPDPKKRWTFHYDPCGCAATRGVDYPPEIFKCPICGGKSTPKFIERMGVVTECKHKAPLTAWSRN